MKFKILLFTNSLQTDITDDLNKFLDWIRRKTPLEPEITGFNLNLPLKFKDFNVQIKPGINFYGLDGIKEQLRNTGLVNPGQYHCVIFIYNADNYLDTQLKPLGAWTYPHNINGSVFIESPFLPNFEPLDNLCRILTHEFIHGCHLLNWWQGGISQDTMDRYDDEYNIESTTGNRARNLKELESHWERISKPTRTGIVMQILSSMMQIVSLISMQVQQLFEKKTELKVEEVKTLDESLTPMPESKLFTLAKETLGKDASPRDLVSDGVGCAESVSTLIKKIVPTFSILTGTWSIYDALKGSKYFTPVLEATLTPGDIILCVTGMGNGTVKNGHVGIVGDDLKIMSNNSKTGIWEYNFTLQTWKDYFVKKGGYKLYCYRLKVV